tara:strand:- start:68 stop:268 length:201 start_codon:yes stop_codon:yes gene_type:complete
MAALVKLIIVFILSLIGFSQKDAPNSKDAVTTIKTENCEPHHKCVHASFHGKYDLQVYDIKRNCTT